MSSTSRIAGAVRQVVPPPGLTRALAVQALTYATGSGVFQAGSAVFFTRVLGLSATQVGAGLSVAAMVSLMCSVPLGALADRLGARRVWLMALPAEAALFVAYPHVGGFAGFLAVVVGLALAESAAGMARHVYSITVIPTEDRVRTLAYQRSALNVGFTLGAAIAGAALAIDTVAAYHSMVYGNALTLLVTALFVLRLPRPPRNHGQDLDGRGHPRMFAALADRPFVAVSLLSGLLLAHSTIFLVVLPLWVLTRTDAPRALVAVLFMVNTVLAVLLQVRASRGAETASGSARALRRGGLLLAGACLILPVAALTSGAATIAVLAAGTIVLTLAELVQSAGAWGITATLPPAERRGEYVGVFRLGGQLQNMLAPAGLTALAVGTGGWGWLPVAALFVAAALVAVPAVAWAVRTPRLGNEPVVVPPTRDSAGALSG